MANILDKQQVLVLNKSWAPHGIVSAYDAICKVMNSRAKFLDDNYQLYDLESWVNHWEDLSKLPEKQKKILVHSASISFVLPEIIVLTTYNGYIDQKVKLSRRNVYERDRYTCQYCGTAFGKCELNLDHVLPRAQGGKSSWKNLVTSCISCNNKKGNRTPKQANMTLLRKPKRPHWLVQGKTSIPKSWEEFVGQLYWDIQLKE